MKIVGIIAEYNPFHNGHRYQIEQALRITGADAAIVLMSGDFMQRGTPALLPKHLRAQMALQGGASVVLELPVCFSVSSAEFFAHGGISILNALGCVDYLCFGSECGDLELLYRTARILSAEPDGFRTLLQDELKKGLSFPAARRAALESYCEDPLAAGLLDHPNNTLGIEYIKALIRLESPIKPFTVKRQESGYHDTGLAARYSSASAIRHILQSSSPDFPESTAAFPEAWAETLTGQLPDAALQILSEHYRTRYPAEADDFSLLLKYRLLKETRETLSSYADVTPELANRIYSQRNKLRSGNSSVRSLRPAKSPTPVSAAVFSTSCLS